MAFGLFEFLVGWGMSLRFRALLPLDGSGSPSEASSENDEYDFIATLETSGAVGFV